jgi:hypothetical protein
MLGQNFLDDLELIAQSVGHALEELPFLLKGFLQAGGMRSLRVSPDYLGKFEHVVSLRLGFLLDPFALLCLVAN